jgi:hypothetical protein
MATLHVLCARCGYDAVVAGVRTVAGARCPGCGDRAVELTDLAPERARPWGTLDFAELERLYLRDEDYARVQPRHASAPVFMPIGCFAPGTMLPR